MITKYFVLDDISSAQYGICLQRWPSFSAPTARVEKVTVSGRNGDLIFYDGSYDNIEGTLSCFVLHEQTYDAVADANRWLLKAGYRRFLYDGDVEAYRLVRVVNGAEIAVRMKRLDPFEIKLDCKPQRFLLSGEIPIVFTSSGVFDCPAYEGLPLLKVTGNGTLNLNGIVITISDTSGAFYIDCDTQNAYVGTINMNNKISAEEFPKIVGGENEIIFSSGIESVEITPRWYTV